MKILKVALSNEAPNMKDVLWLKPVSGGFALYALDGSWKPLKLVDDNNTAKISDDTVAEATSAVKSELLGTSADAATEMTLYGVKAYVDAQIAGLD